MAERGREMLGSTGHDHPLAPFPPAQGDIQQLLLIADPQAAFQACEHYLPGCETPDPPATEVSEGLQVAGESSLTLGIKKEWTVTQTQRAEQL